MEKTHSCKYFRLQVDEYIEGELTDAEMREFEAHIAECEDCRREVESARRLYAILRSSREPAPDGLHSRIMKAVKAEGRSKKKALIFRRSALSAACFFICLSLTIVIVMLPMWNPSNEGGAPLPADPDFAAGETQANAIEAESKAEITDSLADFTEEEQPEALESVPQSSVASAGPAISPSDTIEETMIVAESDTPPAEEITSAPENPTPPTETAMPETIRPETEAEAENAADSVATAETTKLYSKGESKDSPTLSITPSAESTYAPGGEEITMALLVVSGLLAVASFVAFLISLSSVRNTPHKKDKEE